MSETIDPLRKFYLALQIDAAGRSSISAEDGFTESDAAVSYAREFTDEHGGEFIIILTRTFGYTRKRADSLWRRKRAAAKARR